MTRQVAVLQNSIIAESDGVRKIIGIGSGTSLSYFSPTDKLTWFHKGSTVPYVVERILSQGTEVNKGRVFIPTGTVKRAQAITHLLRQCLGFQSRQLIVAAQLTLGDVSQYPVLDVTIDGADEYVVL